MESEVILRTITELMKKDIVALPTHDSITVQETHQDIAADTLKNHFNGVFGVIPHLKIITGDDIGDAQARHAFGTSKTIDEIIQKIMSEWVVTKTVTSKTSPFYNTLDIIPPPTIPFIENRNGVRCNALTRYNPNPKIYNSNAERQAAYRARKKKNNLNKQYRFYKYLFLTM